MNIPENVSEKNEIVEASHGRIRSTVRKIKTDLQDLRSLLLNGKTR